MVIVTDVTTELYESFNTEIADIVDSSENLVTFLTHAMKVVELSQYKGFDEEKDAALQLITQFIDNGELQDDYLALMDAGIAGMHNMHNMVGLSVNGPARRLLRRLLADIIDAASAAGIAGAGFSYNTYISS